MSTSRSTVPLRLYNPIRPSADNGAVTAFGVGACPADQFRFDVNGRGASGGNTVKIRACGRVDDGDTDRHPRRPSRDRAVPVRTPHRHHIRLIGSERRRPWPDVVDPGRVSNNRHGVIGTNDDAFDEPAAEAVNNPPPATNTATTPPTTNKRERPPERPNMPHPHAPEPPNSDQRPTVLQGDYTVGGPDADTPRMPDIAAPTSILGSESRDVVPRRYARSLSPFGVRTSGKTSATASAPQTVPNRPTESPAMWGAPVLSQSSGSPQED